MRMAGHRLIISIAVTATDRTRALLDGRVAIEGVEPVFVTPTRPSEIFWRQIRYGEFDVAEFSLASYLMLKARGSCPWQALPVFPARAFRHGNLYVQSDSPWTDPGSLAGARVGIAEYEQTVGLWVRGILEHEYGVAPTALRWVIGRQEKLAQAVPAGISWRPATADLGQLLADGAIDAVIAPRPPRAPAGRVRPLLTDVRAVEQAWYARTGIFPIMHCVVVRQELLDRHPWLARSLYKAFLAAKDLGVAEWDDYLLHALPWHQEGVRETVRLMGQDWWPYGVKANRATLEAALAWGREQGLWEKPLDLSADALFTPTRWTNEED